MSRKLEDDFLLAYFMTKKEDDFLLAYFMTKKYYFIKEVQIVSISRSPS